MPRTRFNLLLIFSKGTEGRQGSHRSFTFTTTTFMGRRAKYLTAASQTSAQRGYEAKYSASTHAKIVRAASKRARYLYSAGQKALPSPLKCIPHLPPLPKKVHQLYHLPLPETETLYQDALRGAAYLDLSDISRWMLPPPFIEDNDQTDPYSRDYHIFTKNLGFVLDGFRMREQDKSDQRRRIEFNTADGWTGCMEALSLEVQNLLQEFERLDFDLYDEYHASREHAMLQHYAHWQARTIYHLYYLLFLE
ncbi:hypothetical protein DFH06DRAFT_1372529 [Mycena polygramma]|nr:hypothetical protein DFH06DRAFT_1141820 [Mycena polygramma]KAJ7669964.1 hypothetical protein DFH06DRAFT_1372529 [Mycena polygramma]